MNIVQKLLSLGRKARGGQRFTKTVDRILIHWIGPYPGQAVTTPWNWWENGTDGKGIAASAHLIVKDENVLQALPLNEIGYHSGDTRNNHSIGIEVIPKNAAGEFSEKTIKTLQELVRHIRRETGLDLFLERHFDGVQKKDCPRFYTPVTDLVGVDGRVENPEGGDQRWADLISFLNEKEPECGEN
jgi:hypothetical protein